jgi:hypothetical protein
VSGEGHSDLLLTSRHDATGTAAAPQETTKSSYGALRTQARVPVVNLQKVFPHLQSALEALASAIEWESDMAAKANAVSQFHVAFDSLWELRHVREEEFGEMVEVIQGILLAREPESISRSELECIRAVVTRLADEPRLDAATANELTGLMIRGGLDVFRELR